MALLAFKDAFWCSDLSLNTGYEVILQRLLDGRRFCKDVEDLLKQRAIAEEKYGKELIQIAKKAAGLTEINKLRESFETLKQQIESIGNSHIQLATTLKEEILSLEDFRQRQKALRKKYENAMEKLQKNKVTMYKKTMDSKKNYEQKCKEAEEAQQSFERTAIAGNAKQVEKTQSKVKHCKEAAQDADRLYKQNITLLEKARLEWETEHVNTCEAFEQQEKDRISILRNSLWVHSNQFSMQCVKDDEMLEVVRQSLEECDVEAELNFFIQAKTTGRIPPDPVFYESYSNNGIGPHTNSSKVMKRISNLLHGCGGSTKNLADVNICPSSVTGDSEYASVSIVPREDPTEPDTGSADYTVMYDYIAQSTEELDISAGDVVRVIEEGEDGWWTVERNGHSGLVPGSYLNKL
ncbi:proline-serine-threonine phosphatase-interacting protein 1 [Bufo gargarizans]|uniref:proline-serine-threonine phosphatase-interacting protein 1 n=1 Tax=Bufo gargarizans TaxID=30331 RepID=UPI001CF13508|nr:proline-serine-threonine phosphatase-interacting protein 1 [Bufo gargarizans]